MEAVWQLSKASGTCFLTGFIEWSGRSLPTFPLSPTFRTLEQQHPGLERILAPSVQTFRQRYHSSQLSHDVPHVTDLHGPQSFRRSAPDLRPQIRERPHQATVHPFTGHQRLRQILPPSCAPPHLRVAQRTDQYLKPLRRPHHWGASATACAKAVFRTASLLREYGFLIHPEKSQPFPSQQRKWLDFLRDSGSTQPLSRDATY